MEILNYIIYGVGLILGGLVIYYKSNASLRQKVAELISDAETIYKETTKAGGMKFQWVVDQLYNIIPIAIRPFIPKSVIETLVQTTFDAIQNYAKLQLDKLADKVVKTNG